MKNHSLTKSELVHHRLYKRFIKPKRVKTVRMPRQAMREAFIRLLRGDLLKRAKYHLRPQDQDL
jgi:hypothetical protein